ncbi:hypothetical protein BCR33DRAFT_857921 [Rhizoclosmatium globosum]|uniref:BHLH domain-containing protein n=1 Tax=Rhizoclosmatium globosum TaxID=329046 RepID=A0A1Y2B1N3_9FUNG|nr:hypothetical protein BCR33DRAFT_857921 [Rhizoclosmatium globosum]|eukprot:ORY28741.1 hypothetical protein BCR33DRAFT_857921 [Rhizoclosmatium globosum]
MPGMPPDYSSFGSFVIPCDPPFHRSYDVQSVQPQPQQQAAQDSQDYQLHLLKLMAHSHRLSQQQQQQHLAMTFTNLLSSGPYLLHPLHGQQPQHQTHESSTTVSNCPTPAFRHYALESPILEHIADSASNFLPLPPPPPPPSFSASSFSSFAMQHSPYHFATPVHPVASIMSTENSQQQDNTDETPEQEPSLLYNNILQQQAAQNQQHQHNPQNPGQVQAADAGLPYPSFTNSTSSSTNGPATEYNHHYDHQQQSTPNTDQPKKRTVKQRQTPYSRPPVDDAIPTLSPIAANPAIDMMSIAAAQNLVAAQSMAMFNYPNNMFPAVGLWDPSSSSASSADPTSQQSQSQQNQSTEHEHGSLADLLRTTPTDDNTTGGTPTMPNQNQLQHQQNRVNSGRTSPVDSSSAAAVAAYHKACSQQAQQQAQQAIQQQQQQQQQQDQYNQYQQQQIQQHQQQTQLPPPQPFQNYNPPQMVPLDSLYSNATTLFGQSSNSSSTEILNSSLSTNNNNNNDQQDDEPNLDPNERQVRERRVHRDAEKLRRESLKNGFERMKELLPDTVLNEKKSWSQSRLLDSGLQYIQELQAEKKQREREIRRLHEVIRRLSRAVSGQQQQQQQQQQGGVTPTMPINGGGGGNGGVGGLVNGGNQSI